MVHNDTWATFLAGIPVTPDWFSFACRIGGSAVEQQEIVVEHLRQLRTVVNGTRVVSEGDDLDQVAQESLQDEFKGGESSLNWFFLLQYVWVLLN